MLIQRIHMDSTHLQQARDARLNALIDIQVIIMNAYKGSVYVFVSCHTLIQRDAK